MSTKRADDGAKLHEPAALLIEAGATLTRAQALIERAGLELGFPFAEPLRFLAGDVAAIRRRLRSAGTTATGRIL